MPHILDFSDWRDADADLGPKAVSLARLHDAGLPVPPALFISGAVYRAHLTAHGLDALIDSRTRELADRTPDTAEAPAAEAALSEIRAAILAAPLDQALAADLRERHATDLRGGPVAVRSSATTEDLPGHSFAGQHGTYFASDADELLTHVGHCWASLWTDRAFAYRERRGFDHAEGEMAVIVQRLVPAAASGVAFTSDPVSGAYRVVVEACLGLGEALVSGKVTPDRWTFSRPDLELVEQYVATQNTKVHAVPGDRVDERPILPELVDLPSIPVDTARRVAESALLAEELFEVPLDVEWAVEDGRVWLLQARPITTLPKAASDGGKAARPFVWSNANVGEVLPDVVSPMNWTIIGGFVQEMLTGLFGKIGVEIAHEEIVCLIGGRAYFNVSVLAAAFRTVPGMGSIDLSEVLGGMQSAVDIPPELLGYEIASVHGSTWGTIRSLPGLLRYLFVHSPKRAIPFCEAARARTEDAMSELGSDLSDERLVERLRFLVADLHFMADGLGFAGTAMSHFSTLSALTRRWLGDDSGALVTGLMMGQGGVVSAEAGLALWGLAVQAEVSIDVREIVLAGGSWEETRERLEGLGGAGKAFLRAWDEFMREHGHHSRGELEVANARWAERPDYILDIVRDYVRAGNEKDALAEHARQGSRAERLASESKRRLANPLKRAVLSWSLGQARRGAVARELVKSEGVRRIAAVRLFLLELGRRMVDRGLLNEAEDLFFLKWDEWESVLTMLPPFDTEVVVGQRRARYERDRQLTPPPVVIGEWDPEATPSLRLGADRTRLSGIGVSPGVARGPARVIASVEAHEKVRPGEILVAPFTDPGWTPYFLPAAGIVMDMGGMLSHGSIIAREYGIPAVVNVGPATSIIKTGDEVEVDGDAGEVRLV